jgi:4,5-DOPA dioxygenase extradiol
MASNVHTRSHIKECLSKLGINLKTNIKRGYDHGVFIPLMLMYPESKIPVVQISILKSLDPEEHFRMGLALRELKN